MSSGHVVDDPVILDTRKETQEPEINPAGRYNLKCDLKSPDGTPCNYSLTVKGTMVDWAKGIMRRHVEKHRARGGR